MKQITQLWMLMTFITTVSCYHGHGLSPTAEQNDVSGIRGRITFLGTWPDSTKEVRITVLKNYPEGMTDPDSLLAFVIGHLAAFSDTIPKFVDHYDYQLSLTPGLYAWVLVVWFPDIPLYFFGVKELGAYYNDQSQSDLPKPVNVIPGVTNHGIDIVADFDNLNRETPFFKRKMKP